MSLRVIEEEFDYEEEETRKEYDYIKYPYWLDSKDLQKKEVEFTSSEETSFWKDLIKTYLTPDLSRETILRERDQPMKKNEDNALEKKQGLEALRNQVVLTFIIINSLFVVTVFLLQQQKDIIHINWPLDAMPNITFIRYQVGNWLKSNTVVPRKVPVARFHYTTTAR
ncbi:Chitin synthase_ putative [Caligus rogercresseyi]|uniref:Chitin synthase_ putative n=1 Tax=Caligus rogercresseyi TaxID=217165 RepID=A0A7T8GWU8_CALRO|nr:Chitin synthase_ putative [Caligus rogercresseyi]